MAGLIDGDGHVKIKNNRDRIIPQGVIRIASDRPLDAVAKLIRSNLACEVHFEYAKQSKGVDTCFYITKKNIDFLKINVHPMLRLLFKKEKLLRYFNMKSEPAGIRNSVLQE